jgi:hypothetical protein
MSNIVIHGPEPVHVEGRPGARYWVHRPATITGHTDVDDALSSYPLLVFVPHGRDPRQTPLVIALQGLAAPWQWNAFLVPTLLDMGIACALFDTPLAGERSLIRDESGDVIRQVIPLAERGVTLTTPMVLTMADAVMADLWLVKDLLRDRHGLRDARLALFGVSLGCLLTGYAFTREGLGQRLLGAIGHPDLRLFARSYAPFLTPLLVSLPGRAVGKLLSLFLGRFPGAALAFLRVLNDLCRGGEGCARANPMTYADRVDDSRRVRFLVGQEDHLVRPQDAAVCAGRFRDGACYVVPGLGHGTTATGPSFVEHVRTFLGTQLGDWRW